MSILTLILFFAGAGAETCTSVTRTHFGFTVEFTFNCDGVACVCGTFVNGDYWVVPGPSGSVTIENVTPDGEEHGMEVNPVDGLQQGILMGYSNYDSSRNLMNLLPVELAGGSSLIKYSSFVSFLAGGSVFALLFLISSYVLCISSVRDDF